MCLGSPLCISTWRDKFLIFRSPSPALQSEGPEAKLAVEFERCVFYPQTHQGSHPSKHLPCSAGLPSAARPSEGNAGQVPSWVVTDGVANPPPPPTMSDEWRARNPKRNAWWPTKIKGIGRRVTKPAELKP